MRITPERARESAERALEHLGTAEIALRSSEIRAVIAADLEHRERFRELMAALLAYGNHVLESQE